MKINLTKPSRQTLLTDNRVSLILQLFAICVFAYPAYVGIMQANRAAEQATERVEFIEQGMSRRRGNTWRVADSLVTLRNQANKVAPKRSKSSDGSIGDAAHASRTSDHNPWVRDGGTGVVTAIDLTCDPADGFDCKRVADSIIQSRDSRVKYIIYNRRIASAGKGWTWRRYAGSNPHDKHIHISVQPARSLYDNARPWSLTVEQPKPEPTPKSEPTPQPTPVSAKVVAKPAPTKITTKSPTKTRLIVVIPDAKGDRFISIPSAHYTPQKFFTVNQSDLAGRAFRRAAPSVRTSLRSALFALGYSVDHGTDKTKDKADPRYYIWVARLPIVQSAQPSADQPVADQPVVNVVTRAKRNLGGILPILAGGIGLVILGIDYRQRRKKAGK